MGQRGPAPTPTNVLKLRGSWRARRPGEPQPRKGSPPCPDWLDERGRSYWRKACKILRSMGVLTVADGVALGRYVECLVQWILAVERLRSEGCTIPRYNEDGEQEGFRLSPVFKVAESLNNQLGRLEQQFGLTPSARARLTAVDEEIQRDRRKESFLRVAPSEART